MLRKSSPYKVVAQDDSKRVDLSSAEHQQKAAAKK